jgi:hypothetical protein
MWISRWLFHSNSAYNQPLTSFRSKFRSMRRIERRNNNIHHASGPCHPQPVTKITRVARSDKTLHHRVSTKVFIEFWKDFIKWAFTFDQEKQIENCHFRQSGTCIHLFIESLLQLRDKEMTDCHLEKNFLEQFFPEQFFPDGKSCIGNNSSFS